MKSNPIISVLWNFGSFCVSSCHKFDQISNCCICKTKEDIHMKLSLKINLTSVHLVALVYVLEIWWGLVKTSNSHSARSSPPLFTDSKKTSTRSSPYRRVPLDLSALCIYCSHAPASCSELVLTWLSPVVYSALGPPARRLSPKCVTRHATSILLPLIQMRFHSGFKVWPVFLRQFGVL